MKKIALIGRNIKHSKSAHVYNEILGFKCDYSLLDYNSEELIKEKEFFYCFDGINITSPYKKFMIKMCDELTPIAKKYSSINCIRNDNGILKGDLTDYYALKNLIPKYCNQGKVAVLGDGVMSRLVVDILERDKRSYHQYSRKIDGNISKLDLSGFQYLINCCSRDFIFNGILDQNVIFFDLNYSNNKMEERIRSINSIYIDGYELLVEQARHALKFWNF